MLPVVDAVIKNNNISIDAASLNIKIFGKFEELLKKHYIPLIQWGAQERAIEIQLLILNPRRPLEYEV